MTFAGALPARRAFSLGRVLVMPSRAESFPYIVLEAAAGRVPLIATRVGGIAEITAGTSMPLIAPDNVEALSAAMFEALEAPELAMRRADELQAQTTATFTVAGMTRAVLAFYGAVLPSLKASTSLQMH